MKRKMWLIAVALLLVAALVGACGAAMPSSAPAPASAPPFRSSEGKTDNAAGGDARAPGSAPVPAQPQSGGGSAAVADRLIIKTATIALTVKDSEAAFETVKTLTASYGGFVSNSSSSRIDKTRVRIIATVRVPAAKYDEAVKAFKQTALRVDNEKLGGQDVTEEYTDLNARLRNLEATEKELLALMTTVRERMQKAEDILAVQRELNNVRMQIEQLKGRIQFLERSVDLATITVDLTPEAPEAPVTQEGWDPLRVARDALRSLVTALQGLANVLIYVVVLFAPIALILAVPAVLVVRWLRRPRKPKAA